MHVSSTARRYGRALARVAVERKKEKTVRAELGGLSDFLEAMPLARLTLQSPAASLPSKLRILDRIEQALEQGGKPLTGYTSQTLRALAENKRFHLLDEVVAVKLTLPRRISVSSASSSAGSVKGMSFSRVTVIPQGSQKSSSGLQMNRVKSF